MSSLNIVFFVTSLNSGGLENYLLRFLTEKHKKFNHIYVWCKSGAGGQLESSYTALHNISVVKVKLGYFGISSYNRLKVFIKTHRINVVCDFTGNFSGRVLYTVRKAGVKKRVAAYRSSSDRFKKNLLRSLYNGFVKYLTYNNSTDIIANSEAAFDYFYPNQWKEESRFSVIYNGLNSKFFLSEKDNLRSAFLIPNNAFVIGHTGRFNEAKNHFTIIEVAKELLTRYEDIYFILCGNNVELKLTQIIKEKKIADRVLLFENRSDIPMFLNTMDCYFFPSITEGQPNALLEAMVMGLPFVASDIAPIRETVGNNYPLYPAKDIQKLCNALEEKYLENHGRDFLLQNETIKRFDFEKRFEEFFNKLKTKN